MPVTHDTSFVDDVDAAGHAPIAALPNVEWMQLAGTAVFATDNSGANELQSNAVANGIVGNAGDDTLFGGGGNDTLNGSQGNNVLFGGTGADAFTFSATGVSAAHADVIMDFNSAEGDRLDLNDANFTAIGAVDAFSSGDVRFYSAIGASEGHDADDRIVYDSGSGSPYYDADGDGAGSAVPVFTLASAPDLQDTDVFIIQVAGSHRSPATKASSTASSSKIPALAFAKSVKG